MKRGFYNILCAQFLSSLADNALLIAAIALLTSLQAPEWMTPLLKLFFVVSYVLLAAGLPVELAHGSVRFSFGRYNTMEDVDYVLEKLPPIIDRIRAMSTRKA